MKYLLLLSLFASSAFGARFVVESKRPLSLKDLKASPYKIEKFYPGTVKGFETRYIVSGSISEDNIRRLSWVKDVEMTYELTRFSLTHPNSAVRLVQDVLFPYQWGLVNQQQTFFREKDDIHNIPITGTPGKDIGWKNLYQSRLPSRPIVAVLDSGVDLTHDDIEKNLWKNIKECGKDPKVDNDGNQLTGDCDGWNFTEAIDSDAAKKPNDTDGHGTHVAGIIAAGLNGFGTVGVAPDALIMPVKVMRDSNSKSDIPSSESFARGILYAVDNGAQVINMSLGWPRSLETKYLRDAVSHALSNGVVIVAAAGNNNSVDPLFPCAYEGVICVAASTLDGTFAGFSNYGSHVDTVAPGDGILSLNPEMYSPEFFPVHGYDVKSGTSQAAPFVAGLIAATKALEKDITIDELLGRIYQNRAKANSSKYIMGGEANWENLSRPVTSSVVRPILKRVRQIQIRAGGTEAKVVVPVRNFGLESSAIVVSAKSLSPSVTLDTQAFTIEGLNRGETKDVSFAVTNFDLNGEANVKIQVTISENGTSESYLNEIPVVRDIRADAELKKLPFVFTDKPLPVAGIKNGSVIPTISTVDSFIESGAHEYYMKRTLKDGEKQKLEITLFTLRDAKYVQSPNFIIIEDYQAMVNFIRVDLNLDGKEDYLVQTISLKDGKKYFDFSFFNQDLRPLWSEFPKASLTLDLALENLSDLAFMKYSHAKLGTIMVPAFFTTGQLPKIDQIIEPGKTGDLSAKTRLYYLEPQEKTFRVRALTTRVWEEKIKKELKMKFNATVFAEQILPQTEEDRLKGQVRIHTSVGYGTKREIYIVTFSTSASVRSGQIPQLVLESSEIDSVLDVTSQGLKRSGEVYFNVYDRLRADLVTLKDSKQENELNFDLEDDTDIIAGHLMTFTKGSKKFSVIQSREELIAVTQENGKTSRSSRAKLRYSFLSSKLLSELYFPVSYRRNNQHHPALYVDSTAVTMNRIYLFEEQAGKLVMSIRNSLLVPREAQLNCKALNPRFSQTSGTNEFQFICHDGKEWAIRSFEMN